MPGRARTICRIHFFLASLKAAGYNPDTRLGELSGKTMCCAEIPLVKGSFIMPQKSAVILFLLLSLTFFCIGGCAPVHREAGGSRVEVVATIFPLSDIAARLGGEKIAVSCLLPPGASPHSFEPTAEQAREAARASLFVYMGGSLDDWAVKTARAGSEQLFLLNLYEKALADGWTPPPGKGGGVSGNRFNPHLWLDPLTVRDYLCPALGEALVEADRENEDYYRANLAAYQAELSALDDFIRAELAGLTSRSFISVHEAWTYFAARYDLEEAAVIADFPGQEPSAAWLAELLDLCRAHRVRVVSVEPQLSGAFAGMIAGEIDGRVVLLDPLGGAGLSRRDSYINLMHYNTAVLKDALSTQ